VEGLRVGKLSGAVGTYASTTPEVERLACEALGLEPAPASTQILQRDRHAELLSALALLASSLDRFALEIRHLARTEVREVEEPFGRGQKVVRDAHKRNPIVAERICGLARSSAAMQSSGSRTSPSGTSATSLIPPRNAWCYPMHSWQSTTCSTASRGSPRVSSSDLSECERTSRRRADSSSASGRVRARRPGLARDEAYWPSRHAMRAWDAGPTSRPVRADSDHAAPTSTRFDLAARTRHTDVVFQRLHALRQEEGSMPDAVHVASGRSAIYALDDERLLLVAATGSRRRRRPADLIRTRGAADGPVGLLVARTRELVPQPSARAAAGRADTVRLWRRLPIECVARVPGRSAEATTCSRSVRPVLPSGLRESERLPEPIFTPATKASEGHDENIDEEHAAELCGANRYSRAKEASLALYRFASAHAEGAGSSSPTRSSSSGRARRDVSSATRH
jgi:hypothetical protein